MLEHMPLKQDNVAHGEHRTYVEKAQISRTPNFTQYQERTRRILAAGGLPDEVPQRWPAHVSGAQTWKGSDINEQACIFDIGRDDFEELAVAIHTFRSLGLSHEKITKDTFPLPSLGFRLSELADSLFQDRGFFVLRGLDSRAYTPEDWVIVTVGLCCYICTEFGSQGNWDGKRHMLSKSGRFGQQSNFKPAETVSAHILNTPMAAEPEHLRPATSTPEALV
ncbi:MAG: hypothetical protein Q9227_008016 [Pyrenula ochraceoflavens]